ncbi:MAG: hypothetical protein IPI72_08980 [Flavobacteriales bacterium]|nr:hypothetical protein [Flavobacteriales bacterium]
MKHGKLYANIPKAEDLPPSPLSVPLNWSKRRRLVPGRMC